MPLQFFPTAILQPLYPCNYFINERLQNFLKQNRHSLLHPTPLSHQQTLPRQVQIFPIGPIREPSADRISRADAHQLQRVQVVIMICRSKKASCRRERPTTTDKQEKVYKNMKERAREGEELKKRLKSMRETRRSMFEEIKKLKE